MSGGRRSDRIRGAAVVVVAAAGAYGDRRLGHRRAAERRKTGDHVLHGVAAGSSGGGPVCSGIQESGVLGSQSAASGAACG